MKTLYNLLIALVCILSFTYKVSAAESNSEAASNNACVNIDLYMYDSYGDGWNGATWSLVNWEGITLSYGSGPGAGSSITYLCIPAGCYTMVVTGGAFPSEISWAIYGANSFVSGGAPASVFFSVGSPTYGCTDNSACNYYASATCDNGSCCYGYCAYVFMNDSYGDGWEGGYLRFTANDGSYSTVSLNDGYSDSEYLCLEYGCYEVKFFAGGFPLEVSWSVYTPDSPGGGLIYQFGGSPYFYDFVGLGSECNYNACADPVACNYDSFAAYQTADCCLDNCASFYMFDSYGDGWNGAQFILTDWHGSVIDHGTLNSSDGGYESWCLADGCYTITTTGGDNPNEGSWQVSGLNVPFLSGVLGESGPLEVGTLNSGCTDAAAPNYNPNANCNDGSCISTCPGDLDGNGYVNIGDLLLFTSAFGTYCP